MRALLSSRAPGFILFALALSPAASLASPSRAAATPTLVVCVRDTPPSAGNAFPTSPERVAATRARLAERALGLGLRLERGLADGLSEVVARDGAGAEPSRGRRRQGAGSTAIASPFELDPDRVFLLAAPDSARWRAAATALAADPTVEWVDGDPTRDAALVTALPDDPLLRDGRQWGLVNLGPQGPYGGVAGADVGAMAAWTRSAGAAEVLLAVADTGVDPGHPDLAGATSLGPRLSFGVDVAAGGSWADSTGHGTAVAGVMAARTGNGAVFDSLGVAGMCGGDGGANPGCRVVPIRVTRGHALTATSFDIARAIVHATRVGARAVNLSFTSTARSRVERMALAYAIVRGCVVVAAAGNQGATAGTAPQYPAAYAVDGLCVQVGAMDPSGRRAVFSSYGPGLDVLAPGQQVWTTAPTYALASGAPIKGYVAASGTSFAAPFAAGTIGLLAAARPELTDSDFQRLLRAGARDLGTPGRDAETGWGALDAGATLALAGEGVGVLHDETPATHIEDVDRDTLVVVEEGPGALRPRTWPDAWRVAVSATIAVPDSFADTAAVWPRVGGTMAVRGDWLMPYFTPFAEVVERRDRLVTLRGYLFRVVGEGGEDLWLPLPPDQARFGYTVLGPVRARASAPSGERIALAAGPNPFTGSARITHPPSAALSVIDVSGRRVRRLDPPVASTTTTWNGRDDAGRDLPAGLYWVTCRTPGGSATTRILKLR